MPRGPAPSANPRRRNARTINFRHLPAEGRPGRAPTVPKWVELGDAGKAWWRWAWRTPQATAWSNSDGPFVARRAMLEDDLTSIETVEGLDFEDLIEADNVAEIDRAVRRVAALATGRLQLFKEMRELDNRLGLNPKAMIDLRWVIEEPPPASADDDDDDDPDDDY